MDNCMHSPVQIVDRWHKFEDVIKNFKQNNLLLLGCAVIRQCIFRYIYTSTIQRFVTPR